MEKKDKELLLKDLCARLPYGVKVCYITLPDEMPKVWDLIGMPSPHLADIIVEGKYRFAACDVEENIRPYILPLSSMTEEEQHEYDNLRLDNLALPKVHLYYPMRWHTMDYLHVDWLNANHFDYRGLIEKGLAIKVTPENNPYK